MGGAAADAGFAAICADDANAKGKGSPPAALAPGKGGFVAFSVTSTTSAALAQSGDAAAKGKGSAGYAPLAAAASES